MRHTHHAEQWLPHPVEVVFSFFASPANLPRLMPPWQKARIDEATILHPKPRPIGVPSPAYPSLAAGQGSRMTISFRPVPYLPLRLKWDAEISEFEWDSHFCDVQLKRGPFRYWRHCHRVEASSRNGVAGTLLRDQVEYELPPGALGRLANSVFVARQMDYIFRYRQTCTEKLLAKSAGHTSPQTSLPPA